MMENFTMEKVMADLKVRLGSLILDNPVIPASGTFGFGKEFAQLYDLNILSSISFKGTTVEERQGNPQCRIAECKEGMLNSVGLQNPGMKKVIEKELPDLGNIYKKPLIANISGFSADEFVTLAEAFSEREEVGILEINISCPNIHAGGENFGTSAKETEKITAAVKKASKKPIFVKLTPNVTDICEIAKAAEYAGADGISLINTLLGMRIDIKGRRPVLSKVYGGYSGPGVFPVALRMVNQVFHEVNIPIMGMGGISTAEDVIEMIMAGANAVQIGAANLVDPWICPKIIEELPLLMERLEIDDLESIRGIV